jgi:hypothetical protein
VKLGITTSSLLFTPTGWEYPVSHHLNFMSSPVRTHMSGGVAWYDNEWGYSNKCLEMVRVVAKEA